MAGMAKTVDGICHICGCYKKLSFEHVPPEAAFNDRRILHTAFEKVLESENLDELPGRVRQRGAGAYTLCGQCNSDTGSWYAGAYAKWAHQAMSFIIGARGRPSLAYPFTLFPLRALKQVVCMFFSVNGPLFQRQQPDLVRFVLNRESQEFPAHIRIFAFYTFSDRARTSSIAGLLRGFGGANSRSYVFSEITFPPFGFVMTVGDLPPPEATFCNISGFSGFKYTDWRTGISMKLPLMPIYTLFPGDYRTREQTVADIATSKQFEAEFLDGVRPE